jgi:hypothetical protein
MLYAIEALDTMKLMGMDEKFLYTLDNILEHHKF